MWTRQMQLQIVSGFAVLLGIAHMGCGTSAPAAISVPPQRTRSPPQAERIVVVEWPADIERAQAPGPEAIECAVHSSVAWHFALAPEITRIVPGRSEGRQPAPMKGPPLPRFVLMASSDIRQEELDFYQEQGQLVPSVVTAVRDGYLFGFDMGEWRGSLWWRDTTGTEHTLIAKDLNVKGLLKTSRGDTLVVDGLAACASNHGTVTRLTRSGPSWRTAGEVQLGGEPQGWFQLGRDTLVVSAGATLQWINEETLTVFSVIHVQELDYHFQWIDGIAPATDEAVLVAFAYYIISVERDGTISWHAPKQQEGQVCCHCTPIHSGGT